MNRNTRNTSDEGANRFWPKQGTLLHRGHIRGPWRPTGSVAGCGVFAVAWTTGSGEFWAPLHDFDQVTRDDLIAECLAADRDAGFAGAWPRGRA
jgi:hypothetical protein